jgi:xyloglucan fucosyltransferase
MLTLSAAFLYAVLTNRLILIHQTEDMLDLLCEPFPAATCLLPPDFPIKGLQDYNIYSQNSYGYMVEKILINTDPDSPVGISFFCLCAHLA